MKEQYATCLLYHKKCIAGEASKASEGGFHFDPKPCCHKSRVGFVGRPAVQPCHSDPSTSPYQHLGKSRTTETLRTPEFATHHGKNMK